MPYSKKQQTVARMAEHTPEKLHPMNRGMFSMSKPELHKMATRKIKPKKGRQHIGRMVRKPRGKE